MNDWRPYIELSPDFTPAERRQVERALDFVANARDDEGMALLRAGTANQGRRVLIAPAIGGSFSQAGIVGIDFEETRTFMVTENGQPRHVTLNGTMVHELFHVAQYSTSPQGRAASLASRVDALGLTNEARQALDSELPLRLLQDAYGSIDSSLRQGFTRRMLVAERSRETPTVDQYASRLDPIIESSYQLSVDERGTPVREQEATQFTDAFMQKNAGAREPHQGNYRNASNGAPSEQIAYFGPTGELHTTKGFLSSQSEEQPNRPLPQVATVLPTQAWIRQEMRGGVIGQVLPVDFNLATALHSSGVDPRYLNLGTHDGVDRTATDTGSIAQGTLPNVPPVPTIGTGL